MSDNASYSSRYHSRLTGEVTVLAADGVKHEVELDRSGGVLQVHRDD